MVAAERGGVSAFASAAGRSWRRLRGGWRAQDSLRMTKCQNIRMMMAPCDLDVKLKIVKNGVCLDMGRPISLYCFKI
eukprot:6209244-Pleurochrysis_carterae.AAC.1